MVRLLLIVFVAAFGISAACMAAAFAMGPVRTWDFEWRNGRAPLPFKAYPAGSTDTRDFTWSGSDSLELSGAVDVEYRQAPETKLTASGAPELLDRLRVERDEIGFTNGCFEYSFEFERGKTQTNQSSGSGGDCLRLAPGQRVKITVTGPAIRSFEVAGASRLTLIGYDQDRLELDVSGASEVMASGRTRRLDVEMSGASQARLGDLRVEALEAALSGASVATLTPSQSADVRLSGASTATLTTRPAQISSRVTGASNLRQP